MTRQFLRVWQWHDIADITKHLVIIGDVAGDCASCREFGIDIKKTNECPKCHTTFKYIASRRISEHSGERFQITKRLQELKPGLVAIDYDDFQKITGSQKARDFFNTTNG